MAELHFTSPYDLCRQLLKLLQQLLENPVQCIIGCTPHLCDVVVWQAEAEENVQLSNNQLKVAVKISMVSEKQILLWHMPHTEIIPPAGFPDQRSALAQHYCSTKGFVMLLKLPCKLATSKLHALPCTSRLLCLLCRVLACCLQPRKHPQSNGSSAVNILQLSQDE